MQRFIGKGDDTGEILLIFMVKSKYFCMVIRLFCIALCLCMSLGARVELYNTFRFTAVFLPMGNRAQLGLNQ